MIISVSRRTDIPAFFSEWFFNRISEGFVLVRNPMNPHQVSKIFLEPSCVDCFIFWTKNPREFLKKIHLLKNYAFYFQFTLTPYDQKIELNLPSKDNIIFSFIQLSDKIGPNKIVWRYDPIIFNNKTLTLDFHIKNFELLCKKLHKFTQKCVISFFDNYKFASYNSKSLCITHVSEENIKKIGASFAEIAKTYNLTIETCAEFVDLSEFGIKPGKCIDDRLISNILEWNIEIEKDKYQRKFCGCVKSVDIGAYSTCLNNCLYCYATKSNLLAQKHFQDHNPKSPLLFGELSNQDKIFIRKNEKLKFQQQNLFENQ